VALPPSVPPPAPDSLTPAGGSAKSLELILNQHSPEDSDIIKSAARVQAGLDRIRLKVAAAGENADGSPLVRGTAVPQLDLVREAAARHPLALVIEAADATDPKLLQLVEETRAQGVPVVLIGLPSAGAELHATGGPASKPGTQGGPAPSAGSGTPTKAPLVIVAPPAFGQSARQLVASAARNAGNAHLEPKAGAILVIHSLTDSYIEGRASALREALKEASVGGVDEIRFEHGIEPTVKRVVDRLRARPKVALVFSTDTVSMTVMRQAANELGENRPFIPAGYTADENVGNSVRMGSVAAAAEFNPVRLVRRAIRAGVAAARGQEVPPRIEVDVAFHDSPASAGAPTNYGPRQRPPDAAKKGP
jgi:hypothetical protein